MLKYSVVRPAVEQTDLTTTARFMFWLMFRNVASDGLVFDDPVHAGIVSQPGCVLASPSWENTATQVTQDYVCHWTRDAAIVAAELSAAYASGVLPSKSSRCRPAPSPAEPSRCRRAASPG
jgi:glucoamylase